MRRKSRGRRGRRRPARPARPERDGWPAAAEDPRALI